MADSKFGYLLVETVDESVSVLVSRLVVPNGSLELSEADSAELDMGGTGDVVGPASAVNDRIAVFDQTTGKLLKDGGSTIAEIVAGSGGLVTSVFGRTGNIVAVANDYTWAQIDKTTSSLANITTRSAGDLTSGTLPDARMPALTGDVTTTIGTVATTIANNAVTLAKMADIATASFLGRNTASTGDPEVLSIATAKTMLGLTGSNTGDVTLAGENYLSIAGQEITANAINLSGTHVTSTLPVTKGGTGTATQFTAGSVVFAGASGVYSQDNAGLFWDDGNNRLGIGTNAPAANCDIHVLKTTILARVTVETTNAEGYAQVGVKGTGREFRIGVGGASETTYGVADKFFVHDGTSDTMRLKLNTSGELEIPGSIFVSNATANLYLKDTSTGLQSASTLVITPQANNALRTTNFTSGLVGWNWSAAGDAEANNLTLRGALRTSILLYNAVLATNGTQIIARSAAKTQSDVVVPAGPTYGTTTVTIDVLDQDGLSHAASQLFVVNDILYMKDGLVGLTWFKVSGVSDQTTFWRYTAIIMAGTNNITYRTGLGTLDYGQSGQGFITLTADQANSPYIQMATHAGTFTSQDASGSLIPTPRCRLGNLNGSYGYASDIYGFGTGEYGVASKAWVTVEQTNGIRMGSNTTTRILLNPDGSGYLANSSISWTTAGALTISANASIAGWTVNAASISSGTTYLASDLNIPVAQGTWFGKGTSGYQGWNIRDGSDRVVQCLTGNGSIYPYLAIFDGTNWRIVIGGLNSAWGSDGSTNSMGMKIWSSAGSKLVEFSDVQNIIAGWTIAATKISSTGIDIHSGASAALAFGTTPPTSASAGTGIWLDRTGLYGISTGTVQAKLDASNGRITAAAGNVILDSRGVNIQANTPVADDDFAETSAVNFRDSTALVSAVYHSISTSKTASLLFLETVPLASYDSRIELTARAAASKAGRIRFTVVDNDGGTTKVVTLTTTDFQVNAKLVINGDMLNVSTAKTPASASATGTLGDWCWDSGFFYICTATNTWKRVAIATW